MSILNKNMVYWNLKDIKNPKVTKKKSKFKFLYLKFGMFLIFILLTINLISASLQKDYTSIGTYGKITLNDCSGIKGFGCLIGLKNKAAEYTLTDNTPYCLDNCHMTGTATLYSEAQLFSDAKFINLKSENSEEKTLSYSQYFIKVPEEYTEKTLTYVNQCKAITLGNNTGSDDIQRTEEVCNDIPSYSEETKTRYIWQEYNYETLPAGTYDWELRGRLKKGESVDAIPYAQDIAFNEWTTWTAANCVGSGGTLTFDGNYCVHTFLTNGTFNISSDTNVSVLLVAGGGGGGDDNLVTGCGGGGGAGGLIWNNTGYNFLKGNYNVTVGVGGLMRNGYYEGRNGTNSSIGNSTDYLLQANGGGGGGGTVANGSNGGSGGGAGAFGNGTGGIATPTGQGKNGGAGYIIPPNFGAGVSMGGGGGAGTVGQNGTNSGTGGYGGDGILININGSNIYYAGGGGSGVTANAGLTVGGLGGGGNGGKENVADGYNGTNGLGGGGGGGCINAGQYQAGSGGSGVVIIRYAVNASATNIIENYITYNNNTFSGSYETFILNINVTIGGSLTQVNLNYGGTLYPASSIIDNGGGNYIISNSFNVPKTTIQLNKTFYWIITINGTNYNSTKNNQTINPFQIDNCGTYSNLLLNYTLYDEDTLQIIPNTENSSTKVSITLYDNTYNNQVANFSLNTTINNTKICIGNLGNNNYYMDVVAQYNGGNNYITRFNYIQKALVNSTTIPFHVPLYNLLIPRSQEFLVTYKDSNFLPQGNVLVDVTRFYPAEGIFRSVEDVITDTLGNTHIHLVLSSEIYTIYFKQNGVILAILNNMLARCDSIAAGTCNINVNAFSGTSTDKNFNYINGVNIRQDFNETTRTIIATFTTSDSVPRTILLNATKINRFGTTQVCSTSLLSSSGIIICAVPNSYGNASILSTIYSNGVQINQQTFSFNLTPAVYNEGGSVTILAIMIVITMSLLFVYDIRGILLGSFLGIILSGLLIFINSGNLLSIGFSIGYIILAGGIILYKINKNET